MYLGLDIGTSSVKGVLIDTKQKIIATASAPLRVSRPQPGWSGVQLSTLLLYYAENTGTCE